MFCLITSSKLTTNMYRVAVHISSDDWSFIYYSFLLPFLWGCHFIFDFRLGGYFQLSWHIGDNMFSPHTEASFHPNGAIKLYNCRRDDISRWNKKSYFLKTVTKLNNFVAYFLSLIILDIRHENIRENKRVIFEWQEKTL